VLGHGGRGECEQVTVTIMRHCQSFETIVMSNVGGVAQGQRVTVESTPSKSRVSRLKT
jgi:hypothetical protein